MRLGRLDPIAYFNLNSYPYSYPYPLNFYYEQPLFLLAQFAKLNASDVSFKKEEFVLHFEYAQLLVAVGRQKVSLQYFETATKVDGT